jgi:putative MFS transporter
MMQLENASSSNALRIAILVAALGYFVDVYDIVVFSIVRVPSLNDLGLSDEQVLEDGVLLLNLQMGGMLLGGILWGLLGDKIGRIQVLFGSILLYSVANIANAFVHDLTTYSLCRFFSGVGLAGEIGAGITLVSEMMPTKKRGLATTLVATIGVSGAIAAALLAEVFHWRTSYIIGGVGGLALLALRIGVYESGMFSAIKDDRSIRKGDILLLFRDGRWTRYISCICVGIPMFFFISLLMALAPEVGAALNTTAPLSAGQAALHYSIGLTLGDVASGLLSQYFRSRKKALAVFIVCALLSSGLLAFAHGASPRYYYNLALLGGFSIGYWAMLLTTAAEQFGTNLRATVASTVPNFVRGSTVGITLLFGLLRPYLGTIESIRFVGVVCFGLGFWGLYRLRETFHVDLDFVEQRGVSNNDTPASDNDELRYVANQ